MPSLKKKKKRQQILLCQNRLLATAALGSYLTFSWLSCRSVGFTQVEARCGSDASLLTRGRVIVGPSLIYCVMTRSQCYGIQALVGERGRSRILSLQKHFPKKDLCRVFESTHLAMTLAVSGVIWWRLSQASKLLLLKARVLFQGQCWLTIKTYLLLLLILCLVYVHRASAGTTALLC